MDELLSARQRQEDSQRPGLVGEPTVLSVAGRETSPAREKGVGQIQTPRGKSVQLGCAYAKRN
jgi:hypothetical protein